MDKAYVTNADINSAAVTKYPKVKLQFLGKDTGVKEYIYSYNRPNWLTTLVIHHTLIPTVAQWRGMSTLQNTWKYYIDKGWDSGPHFFVAPEGIYTMTTMQYQGIHGNNANSFSYGIEVVGNYDTVEWQEPIKSNALYLIHTLREWSNTNNNNRPLVLQPHRKYNTAKTCPGKKITIEWIEQELLKKYPIGTTNETFYTIFYVTSKGTINIRQQPKVANNNIAATLEYGDSIKAGDIKIDENNEYHGGSNQWVHVLKAYDKNGNDKHLDNSGFVSLSVLTKKQ